MSFATVKWFTVILKLNKVCFSFYHNHRFITVHILNWNILNDADSKLL
jgi:hypothetical protein